MTTFRPFSKITRTLIQQHARRQMPLLASNLRAMGTKPSAPLVMRTYSHSSLASSPNFAKGKKKFVPRKAAVELTDKARNFFKALLENNPSKAGIMLDYHQSTSGQPRMVFSFKFVTKDDITSEDEGVSLELLEDGSPKPPRDALADGLPKLYVHHNAFLKVLGAKVDVNTETVTPILYDKEGNEMDPNF
eukprot:Nitzschia sp. Nitz4//scaffold2_size372955//163014//163658//NITZ4_000415-RA/size372955-processed-gene-0.418-mRNA-1//1//CDS//3329546754//4271//frame0